MHRLLQRQLRRHFGGLASVPKEMMPLLEVIDAAYQDAEADRTLLERSLDLTSQELLDRNVQLEREVQRLAAAQRQLESLIEFRTQFINNTAHELATPLTPVVLQLRILQRTLQAVATPEQLEGLRILDRNIQRLVGLVQDVLDSARLQSGRLKIRRGRVAVEALVQEAIQSFRGVADEAKVDLSFSVEKDLELQGDPTRIMQVLFNLLSNAIKFTPANGRVEVVARGEGEMAVLEVTDSGMGIPTERMSFLFQPFSQAHEPGDVTKPGTGLGLYVSKGIVESHGGTLTCVSDGKGRGSRFRVELPLTSVRVPGPGDGMAPSPGPKATGR